MAYFSHAFQKTLIVNNDFVTTGNSSNLGVADCGFYDAKTWNAIPIAQASITQHPKVVFAQGRYRVDAGDRMGSHGGYIETFKSPVIDPLHVHRFWKVAGSPAQDHIVVLGWNGVDAATVPKFYCGQNYHLRIDVKGSPVLRLLDHSIYHTFDVKTKCCTSDTTPELVDPVTVFLNLAQQINENALVSKFIQASVSYSGVPVNPDTYTPLTDPVDIANAEAALQLMGGYSDTRFNYFSFDPRDHYELEPVIIASAQLVDHTGDPCSFNQLTVTQSQAPKSAQGSGNTVLREFILDNEYRQDPFPWDARKKDITDFSWLAISIANPFLFYDSYYILYTIPRKYNPSGVHDNDLYLLRVCAQNASMLTDFEDWFTAYLSSAGTGVVLEDLTV